MKNTRLRLIILLAALLVLTCLVFTACGNRTREDAADEPVTVAEQAEEPAPAEEPAEAVTAEEDAKAAEEAAAQEEAKKAAEEQAAAEKAAEEKAAAEKAAKDKEKADKDKSKKKKKKSSESSSSSSQAAQQPAEKQKVWVEPITETRTVTLDTGTRYCNGANSNGGCGASWHGTKEGTYNSWQSHWQDYVKRRTDEEAAKGNVYVCDHIHDDSRWVPDTTTETVVVQEGYWKEVG